jgi:hypothetical protein
MNNLDFLNYLKTVNVGQHVYLKGKSSEENVKIKIIVPFLQALGWDLLDNIYFENSNVDIVIVDNNIPQIIVETKSWGVTIEEKHLSQCLEYAINLKIPWIIVSSGQDTEIYCAYINPKSFIKSKPIFKFRFDELINNESVFIKMVNLFEKSNFLSGSALEFVKNNFKNGEFDIIKKEFELLTTEQLNKSGMSKLSREKILELLDKLDTTTKNSILELWKDFEKIVENNSGFLIMNYGGKEVTLKCKITWPRKKFVSLVRINFRLGEFYKVEGWKNINCEDIYNLFQSFSTKPTYDKWHSDISELLNKGIEKIKGELAKNL